VRVVIVDDEALARQVLKEFLAAHSDVEIVAECGNGFEAVKAVTDLRPDLLLLDVQMPKLDGFEVVELVGGETDVVFVTAYDTYAIRAFEIHAIDYLLKPFSAERLADALARARQRRASKARPAQALTPEVHADRAPIDRILIRDRGDVHVVPVHKIDYIEAQDDYAAIRSGGKTFLKEQTMGDLESLLDPAAFVRIHRRYLLNVSRLSKIALGAKESHIAILADGTELPISRTGYARLRELL
jgi:two-component system LytT family response regulator